MNRRLVDRLILGSLLLGALVLAPQADADVIYVASNKLAVIDSETGERVADVGLERFVFDIEFNLDGSRAYIAVSDGVIEMDARSHTVLGRLTQSPAFELTMSADGSKLFILGNEVEELPNGMRQALPSTITIYDLNDRAAIATHEVGMRADEFVLAGSDIAVVRPGDFEFAQIALASGSDVRSADLRFQPEGDKQPGFLHGMAVTADGSRIFVAQAASQVVVHSIDAATGARTLLPIDEPGFVTNMEMAADVLVLTLRNSAIKIDPETGAQIGRIDLGAAHFGMAVSDDGRRSYHTIAQVDDLGGAVTVVDLVSGTVERSIPVHGMSPAAIAVQPGS